MSVVSVVGQAGRIVRIVRDGQNGSVNTGRNDQYGLMVVVGMPVSAAGRYDLDRVR